VYIFVRLDSEWPFKSLLTAFNHTTYVSELFCVTHSKDISNDIQCLQLSLFDSSL